MADRNPSEQNANLLLILLTVLFIGLKLTHVIAWSWWLVLLPLYGPVVFVLVIALVVALGSAILGS